MLPPRCHWACEIRVAEWIGLALLNTLIGPDLTTIVIGPHLEDWLYWPTHWRCHRRHDRPSLIQSTLHAFAKVQMRKRISVDAVNLALHAIFRKGDVLLPAGIDAQVVEATGYRAFTHKGLVL